MSVSASTVFFIVLFGIAILDGLVMVEFFRMLEGEGLSRAEAIRRVRRAIARYLRLTAPPLPRSASMQRVQIPVPPTAGAAGH